MKVLIQNIILKSFEQSIFIIKRKFQHPFNTHLILYINVINKLYLFF